MNIQNLPLNNIKSNINIYAKTPIKQNGIYFGSDIVSFSMRSPHQVMSQLQKIELQLGELKEERQKEPNLVKRMKLYSMQRAKTDALQEKQAALEGELLDTILYGGYEKFSYNPKHSLEWNIEKTKSTNTLFTLDELVDCFAPCRGQNMTKADLKKLIRQEDFTTYKMQYKQGSKFYDMADMDNMFLMADILGLRLSIEDRISSHDVLDRILKHEKKLQNAHDVGEIKKLKSDIDKLYLILFYKTNPEHAKQFVYNPSLSVFENKKSANEKNAIYDLYTFSKVCMRDMEPEKVSFMVDRWIDEGKLSVIETQRSRYIDMRDTRNMNFIAQIAQRYNSDKKIA